MKDWYWFGILVGQDGHLKMRQVHVRQESGAWVGECWSKGDAGALWLVTTFYSPGLRSEAMQFAKAFISRWCAGYFTVDEGEPFYAQADANSQPTGAASPVFWADALQVDPGATDAEVKSAFKRRAMETHPDRGGDREEFERVYSAWEYVRNERSMR